MDFTQRTTLITLALMTVGLIFILRWRSAGKTSNSQATDYISVVLAVLIPAIAQLFHNTMLTLAALLFTGAIAIVTFVRKTQALKSLDVAAARRYLLGLGIVTAVLVVTLVCIDRLLLSR